MGTRINGRRNPQFDLSVPEQKIAYDFLGKIRREQGVYLSHIINGFLKANGIDDVEALSREDIKKLFEGGSTAFSSNEDISESRLHEAIKKVLQEQGISSSANLSDKNKKAHHEPFETNEPREEIFPVTETETINSMDEDYLDDDNDLMLNEDLLSELSAFG